MIDSFRGTLRVRKWPRKRGRPRSALQRWWVDWFVQANRLAKFVDGMSAARAIAMTKGSGMYPRDVLLKAMRGRLYTWSTPDGWRWYSMAAIGDVSESLDVLAQTVGSVLVRAVDRWRPPPPGNVNDVFTYKGPTAPPVWQVPSAGPSYVQEVVAGTPIVPDNTVNQYDIDVSLYANVQIDLDGIGFAASTQPECRLSIDGGVTFKAGASDYFRFFLTPTIMGGDNLSRWQLTAANAASGHNVVMWLNNLRVGRCERLAAGSPVSSQAIFWAGRFNFDGPVTHVRIYSTSGSNFNAGTIRAVGQR